MVVAAASLPGVFQTGIHSARPAATAVAAGALYACTTHYLIYQSDGTSWTTWLSLPVAQASGIPVNIGDGVFVISTGVKGEVEIPFACTVTAWRLVADVSGSIVIDVKKASGYAGLPTFASIAASAKPTLSSAQKNQDTTLTGWTVALAQGDWLQFNVESASTVKLVSLSLTIVRT